MPSVQLQQGIRSDKEIKLPGQPSAQLQQGVDSVGRRRQFGFQQGNTEAAVPDQSQLQHGDPLPVRRSGSPFMRRIRCRNKEYLLKTQLFGSLLRNCQMALVDRIKGASEQADPPVTACIVHLLPNLPLSINHKLLRRQLFQTHRAVGMELGGGDADFGTQAKLAAIGKAGGGVRPSISSSSV